LKDAKHFELQNKLDKLIKAAAATDDAAAAANAKEGTPREEIKEDDTAATDDTAAATNAKEGTPREKLKEDDTAATDSTAAAANAKEGTCRGELKEDHSVPWEEDVLDGYEEDAAPIVLKTDEYRCPRCTGVTFMLHTWKLTTGKCPHIHYMHVHPGLFCSMIKPPPPVSYVGTRDDGKAGTISDMTWNHIASYILYDSRVALRYPTVGSGVSFVDIISVANQRHGYAVAMIEHAFSKYISIKSHKSVLNKLCFTDGENKIMTTLDESGRLGDIPVKRKAHFLRIMLAEYFDDFHRKVLNVLTEWQDTQFAKILGNCTYLEFVECLDLLYAHPAPRIAFMSDQASFASTPKTSYLAEKTQQPPTTRHHIKKSEGGEAGASKRKRTGK
jgi:ribosomal protein S27AE